MIVRQSLQWPGVPLALGSALMFGATAPLSKLLLGRIDPWLLAGIMYFGAGLGLLALMLAGGAIGVARSEAGLSRTDVPWLAGVCFFGGLLGPLLLMRGLALSEASTASLLLNIESIATMTMAWLAFRENVDRRLLLGAAAIVGGAVLLSWDGRGMHLNAGSLLVIGACLCWGLDNNLTRKISAADPMQITAIKGLVAGGTNLALAYGAGATLDSVPVLALAALVGFAGIGVSLVMFTVALRHLGAARTGAYFSLAPFIGAGLSVVALGEPLTFGLVAAGVMMSAGLWLHLSESHEHEHEHGALDHEHAHVHDAHHQHLHDGSMSEPHSHWHHHASMRHKHPHYPDLHHQHRHN